MINPFKRAKDQPAEPAPNTGPQGAGVSGPTGPQTPAGGEPGSMPDGPDETAAVLEQLEGELKRLEGERAAAVSERDEARDAHKRALADFQNYQRRAVANEAAARDQGVRGVLYSLMTVIDHFELALLLDPEKTSAKQILDGVTMIKEELLRSLELHGLVLVRPKRGEPFDPSRHEAIMQQAAEGVEPGHIVMTTRLGFLLDGKLVRPAQVAVAPALDDPTAQPQTPNA